MTTDRARSLRKEMTPPERRLWNVLKHRPSGLKFRRQHPLGPYVLDFFCHEAALAIEIDGLAHDLGDNPDRDHRRLFKPAAGLKRPMPMSSQND